MQITRRMMMVLSAAVGVVPTASAAQVMRPERGVLTIGMITREMIHLTRGFLPHPVGFAELPTTGRIGVQLADGRKLQQRHVAVSIDRRMLRGTLDDLSEQFLRPAAHQLAALLEFSGIELTCNLELPNKQTCSRYLCDGLSMRGIIVDDFAYNDPAAPPKFALLRFDVLFAGA